jgi:hypothetical protein
MAEKVFQGEGEILVEGPVCLGEGVKWNDLKVTGDRWKIFEEDRVGTHSCRLADDEFDPGVSNQEAEIPDGKIGNKVLDLGFHDHERRDIISREKGLNVISSPEAEEDKKPRGRVHRKEALSLSHRIHRGMQSPNDPFSHEDRYGMSGTRNLAFDA